MDKIHYCEVRYEGNEMIMTCQKCKGFERRLNLDTNEITVKNKKEGIRHVGQFINPSVTTIFNN